MGEKLFPFRDPFHKEKKQFDSFSLESVHIRLK